jgi:hypothetical protein
MVLKKAYKRCYDVSEDRTEYKVFPIECTLNREYCFGGFVYIKENVEYSIEDKCNYYNEGSFKECDGNLDCSCMMCGDEMGVFYYCPGEKWVCPVKEGCKHNNIIKDDDNYITPKYVGENGCIYFMKNYIQELNDVK